MKGLKVALAMVLECSLAIPISLGAETSSHLEAEDIFKLEYAIDPRISPDGSSVVFVRETPDIVTDRWYSTLWMVPVGGGDTRPLTRGLHHDTSPRWSPDGKKLAFLSDRSGDTQVYILDLENAHLQRMTDSLVVPSQLAWSPDGKWISFAALEPRPPPEIAVLPSPPQGATWAEPPQIYDRLDYRSDPAGYHPGGFLRLFVLPAAGGTSRRVSRDEKPFHEVSLDPLNVEGGTGSAAWTPDGRFLITSANRRADWELRPLDTEIFEFSLETGSVRALTSRQGPDASPVVSPDGRFLAYIGYDDRRLGYQISRLYLMDLQDGSIRILTERLDRNVQSPHWSGDSQSLLFRYHDRGNTKIAKVDLEGRLTELSGSVGDGYSTYGGGTFSLSQNGLYAFTYSRPDIPVEVAVASVDQGATRVLTRLNEDLLAEKTLGQVEEIWFTSPKDQHPIQGWVIKPPHFEPTRRYPLILDIHGGPFRDYGERFDMEKQIWASHGYLVLYINQRGSAGYGEAFGNLIHHAYPSDEFFDLKAAVSMAIERGWADPENLFITGGSGGGLLTCWMIAHTKEFRAAVAAYPLVNWASFVLTTDISAQATRDWFPGPPWEYPEHYRSRSPLWQVGDVKTPTMIIVGGEDYRTPDSEGEQYYAALKHQGVETVLVRFPTAPHFAERHPSQQIARVLLTLGWFDRYHKEASTYPTQDNTGR